MKNIFKIFRKEKTLYSSAQLEILPNEEADKALGGYREYKPNIYESNESKASLGKTTILLDLMK